MNAFRNDLETSPLTTLEILFLHQTTYYALTFQKKYLNSLILMSKKSFGPIAMPLANFREMVSEKTYNFTKYAMLANEWEWTQ